MVESAILSHVKPFVVSFGALFLSAPFFCAWKKKRRPQNLKRLLPLDF